MRSAAMLIGIFSFFVFGEVIIDPPTPGPRQIENVELRPQPRGHVADEKRDVHYHDSSPSIEKATLEISDSGIVTLSVLTLKIKFKRVEAILQREDNVLVTKIRSKVTVIDDPGLWTISLKEPVKLSGIDLSKLKVVSEEKGVKLVLRDAEEESMMFLRDALAKALAHDNDNERFEKLFSFKAQGNYDGGVFDGDKKTCLAITEKEKARLSAPFILSAIEYLGSSERIVSLQATIGLMPDSLKRNQEKFSIHLKDSRMLVLIKGEELTVARAKADAPPSLVMSSRAASELIDNYLRAIPAGRLPTNFTREGDSVLVYSMTGKEREEMAHILGTRDLNGVKIDVSKITVGFGATVAEDKGTSHFLALQIPLAVGDQTEMIKARYSTADKESLRFIDVTREGDGESHTLESDGLLKKHFSSLLRFALLGVKARPRIDNPDTFTMRLLASEITRPDTFGDQPLESQLLEIFAR